jgi:hypothetical protein
VFFVLASALFHWLFVFVVMIHHSVQCSHAMHVQPMAFCRFWWLDTATGKLLAAPVSNAG